MELKCAFYVEQTLTENLTQRRTWAHWHSRISFGKQIVHYNPSESQHPLNGDSEHNKIHFSHFCCVFIFADVTPTFPFGVRTGDMVLVGQIRRMEVPQGAQ